MFMGLFHSGLCREIFRAHAQPRPSNFDGVNIFIVEGFNKKDLEGVIYRRKSGIEYHSEFW